MSTNHVPTARVALYKRAAKALRDQGYAYATSDMIAGALREIGINVQATTFRKQITLFQVIGKAGRGGGFPLTPAQARDWDRPYDLIVACDVVLKQVALYDKRRQEAIKLLDRETDRLKLATDTLIKAQTERASVGRWRREDQTAVYQTTFCRCCGIDVCKGEIDPEAIKAMIAKHEATKRHAQRLPLIRGKAPFMTLVGGGVEHSVSL